MDAQTKDAVDRLSVGKDVKELVSLAESYRKGKGVKKDIDAAVYIDRILCNIDPKYYVDLYDDLRKRRDEGDIEEANKVLFESPCDSPDMKYRRASAYLHGTGIERDIEKGWEILEPLTKVSERYALKYIESTMSLKATDRYKDAFEMCARLKWKDHLPLLAKMYSKGIGTEKNLQKASDIYLKIGDAVSAADCILKAGFPEKAEKILESSEDSPEKSAILSVIRYDEGRIDEAIELMYTSASSSRPWAKSGMDQIAGMDGSPEWKYATYSVFADRADKETCLKVLKNYPEDPTKKKMQNVELHLLNALNECCKEIGIEAMIDGGNLLGIVRHGGFVPWDDDVDVRVFEKDVERLKRHLSENDRDYYVTSAYAYGSYYKFRSILHGGWIDIFPLESQVIYNDHTEVTGIKVTKDMDPNIEKVFYRVKRDSQTVACKSYFEEKELFPLKKSDLCGVKVNIPADPDSILTSFYKRWYALPKTPGEHLQASSAKNITDTFDKARSITDRMPYILKTEEIYRTTGDTIHADLWHSKAVRITIDKANALYDLKTEEGYAQSLETLRKMAEKDVAVYLGRAYREGKGVKKDNTKAAEYFRMCENRPIKYEQMFFDTLWDIGTESALKEMFDTAVRVVGSNPKSAWMKGRLGKAYFHGKGTPKNWEKAKPLLEFASKGGVKWADAMLDKMKIQL